MNLNSWIRYDIDCPFPVQNFPWGIYADRHSHKKPCSIIGDYIIDLHGLFSQPELRYYQINPTVFETECWNSIFALGKAFTRKLKKSLQEIFTDDQAGVRQAAERFLIHQRHVQMHLPIQIGDYTDFYSSREHATNVGKMFRDPANALLPNWLHLPVAYHGRSSSIVVSGTDIKRPNGQMQLKDGEPPIFGPSRQLDFELEMAFVVGKGNALGTNIDVNAAEEYIQGLMLFNDWSARDIQKWEYVPLGPFLGKNFASSVSPWIVDLDTLSEFKTPGPEVVLPLLPYLQQKQPSNYDIHLEVFIQPDGGIPTLVCQSNTKHLYWSFAQQLAHHTINGCNMKIGDLCASGTISGPEPNSYGSMLELTWKGTKPLVLSDGSSRNFLNNNDTVVMKAYAQGNGYRIGFGDVVGKIVE